MVFTSVFVSKEACGQKCLYVYVSLKNKDLNEPGPCPKSYRPSLHCQNSCYVSQGHIVTLLNHKITNGTPYSLMDIIETQE